MRVRDCSRWGVLSPRPLLVGAAKLGAGKRTRLTHVEGRRRSTCVKGREGWYPGAFRGAEGKGT